MQDSIFDPFEDPTDEITHLEAISDIIVDEEDQNETYLGICFSIDVDGLF